ncbi:MAG: hypothetical protein KAR35_04350 [Candidatus Heimdallarchaeota archaeon]|nr:hypothetical protein [Candidatus Heimdallarchaeota archaeon]MCK5048586.1 hypothetical protein [Candidatus Heimdallarchaeota archaeon]
MVVIIKKLTSFIAFFTFLIILVLNTPVHAELVTFEETVSAESDVTFYFEVNYDKLLENNAQTTVSIIIDLPIYPTDMTKCSLTTVGLTLTSLRTPEDPIFVDSYDDKVNDFLDTSEFSFSLSFTPDASLDESPDGYFDNYFISLVFYIDIGFNDASGSTKAYLFPRFNSFSSFR